MLIERTNTGLQSMVPPVAYLSLAEFETRIPGAARFDFSAATIPMNV